MKVLWLASWYPSKAGFLDGDFIERHAEAASLYHSVFVIHVVKYKPGKESKIMKEEKFYSDNLSAVIYYYPSHKNFGRVIDILFSNILFCYLHIKAYREYRSKYNRPDGILVQVGLKAGIMAVLYKWFLGIPFILFERWTGLLKEAKPNFSELSYLKKWWWQRIIRSSEKLVTVSKYFAESICMLHFKKEYAVIPNTIREHLFFPVERKEKNLFRFIHVSNMDYQKNFEDILRAMAIVIKKNIQCEMVVYGPVVKEIQQLTDQLDLSTVVVFKGEVTHAEIAKAMQDANVLVLYSRYETFGNVITEANACGLPVIVSDHPVFTEIVKEGITGITVKGNDPSLLAQRMEWIKSNYQQFDRNRISAITSERYGHTPIAQLFDNLFTDFLKR